MADAPPPNILKRRWPLLAAAVVILAGAWFLRKRQEAKMYGEEAAAEASEAPQVKAYKVRRRNLAGALKRIGTIKARAETNLQFGASGRVTRFEVEKGQFVKKGAVVASLDQEEAKHMLTAVEMEYQKTSAKYFQDRTIDRLEYERAKARYNQAKLEAGKTIIRAPHDGYLVEKQISAGEQVDGGTVVGKIMDKSRVSVEMDLSEDDIRHLKIGQKVAVTVDAVPDYKAEGEVASVTPYLKGDSRSFNVKVSLPGNPDEALNPGMFARCTIRRYEKAGALVVPLEAGGEMGDNKIKIFTVDGQNTVRARTLPVLFMDEGVVEVEGLAEGDLVVLNPGAELQDGAKVDLRDVFDPESAQAPAPAPGSAPLSTEPAKP
ncbi:MAG: efflux RND transporter periplasmic adaptor subunit [Elusimicrobiota bacterium]